MSFGRTLVLGLAFGCAAFGHSPTAAPGAAIPVLVELFTAEGCSSCPPADRLLEQMVAMQPSRGAAIVGLGEHVDYWDRLGWKDRFSSAQFTARQQRYADRLNLDTIYTPQMVVDGKSVFVGSDADAARRAIDDAAGRPHGVLRVTPAASDQARAIASVIVESLPPVSRGDRAELLVALTEDRLKTEVKRGENQGRTLTHAVVVRELKTVGDAVAGQSTTVEITLAGDWRRDALAIVAFVQERSSRRVLATGAASAF